MSVTFDDLSVGDHVAVDIYLPGLPRRVRTEARVWKLITKTRRVVVEYDTERRHLVTVEVDQVARVIDDRSDGTDALVC